MVQVGEAYWIVDGERQRSAYDAAAMPRPRSAAVFLLCSVCLAPTSCDSEPSKPVPPAAAPPAESVTATPPAEPPRAPDIVVDATRVAIGNDRVVTGEPGLADRVAVFVTGRPTIEGHAVGFVAMRNAKPSHVAAVVTALRRGKAIGAIVNSEARDGTSQQLPLSFATTVPDCATVAWIAKNAAIDVWRAGGGTAKRIVRGLAGPDITLGTEAVRTQAIGCSASELVAGADESMTWGLIFDLATSALQSPGARASAAVFVSNAVPGRKVVVLP
jgi:hypothetical protein